MSKRPNARSGGQILVDQLAIHGVDTVFSVPGESFLAVLDALYDARERIRLITCRMEAGAGNMAAAYGKLTGRPGICMVTRGPGATHASVGVHTAHQDSAPLILFIGQVGRDHVDREAFQEIDYRRMFGQFTKWVAQIDDPARVPEYLNQAFHVATSGRPGPVVLAIPEDMLREVASVADAKPYRPAQAAPGAGELAELSARLANAERPFMVVGGATWTERGAEDIVRFAEAQGIPTGAAFRCQDIFDNTHPNYAGDVGIGINPKLQQRIQGSDLVIVAGARLDEMTTSAYTLFSVPTPAQPLVHIHPSPELPGRVYQTDLTIVSGMTPFAAAARALPKAGSDRREAWVKAARADYLEYIKPAAMPGPVDMGRIVVWLREHLPADAIITNGAGNYATWIHRFHQYRRFRTQLAPTSGAMGFGVPAGIAGKLVHPERVVVSVSGDGCFLMCGQELATAAQYGAAVIFLVVNNGMYGTIRMHQERNYPARVSGTDLVNPDFVAYARAFGCHGERIQRTEEFAAAFERARASNRPALIEIPIDPEAITPRTTLAAIRKQAEAAAAGR
ncbi:MAG: thiamine pyrophosphate-binding protein [Proteobacteria bacterium]|nr:thiamine pyrophosphate-binding protein [Pseudomonadota bacterium]MBI3507979.1 thiamine pyrophosphate-binding protein [Pseudomonadota bacterium]